MALSSKDDKEIIQKDENETDEIFMVRLKHSKECGRNLFFEEWDPLIYNPDWDY